MTVNCSGRGEYNQTISDILIQFNVRGIDWEINAIGIDSIPHNDYEMEAVVEQMCSGVW